MPFPDYLDQDPKIIFFTDFDGTITRQDCCDYLVETLGYGPEKLKQSNQAVVEGKLNFGEASREQLDSIKAPWNKCIEKLWDDVELDDHFRFLSVGRVCLCSGGSTVIWDYSYDSGRCNEVVPRDGFQSIDEEGSWRVQFRDNSIYGHDKAVAIKPYASHRNAMSKDKKPVLLYAGDGVSDLSAARETELLFAKSGQDLITYCQRENIPFTEFQDWKSILETTQDIYYDRKTVEQIVKEGLKRSKD